MARDHQQYWRRYTLEFGAAMTLYVISVFVTVALEERFAPEGAAALGLAAVPMVPTILALWAFLRHFWRQDELQRRIISESILVAAGVVSFVSFGLGWAIAIARPAHPVLTHTPLLWILPAMAGVWGVAQIFVRRRYR